MRFWHIWVDSFTLQLWDTYKEADSFHPLVYIMRQIIDYYFIHTPNYKEDKLGDRVQVKADNLVVENEKGGLDLS